MNTLFLSLVEESVHFICGSHLQFFKLAHEKNLNSNFIGNQMTCKLKQKHFYYNKLTKT